MATDTLNGRNRVFPIYNEDGTPFHNLVLRKGVVDSIVMSLGDKITGDVYYKDNTLSVTMQEYIEYNGVHYVLVSPPTIVREGMASDNSELKGMTKYSFVFYHPMYMLGNFPFTDVAVTQSEAKYLSQNKTFSWIGTLFDFRDKLNANLVSTEWYVEITIPQYEQDGVTETQQWQKASELSEVLSFDKQFISDALKTGYDQWEIPFVIISKTQTINGVTKNFAIQYGLPSQEIYDDDGVTPFVFKFGQGVGLKNNSRTPKNNKIVTRLAGYGAERNIPYGYPQIVWTGNQGWNYTINNAEGMQPIEIGGQTVMAMSYPIYDGIVNGQRVRLIKHPFTRNHLMPSIYSETVNKKVNPNATGYDPTIEIKDYYDAISSQEYTYPNPINPLAPSYEIHEFEDIKPELGAASIVGISAYDLEKANAISTNDCLALLVDYYSESHNKTEKEQLQYIMSVLPTAVQDGRTANGYSYEYDWSLTSDDYYAYLKYKSSILNFTYIVLRAAQAPEPVWDDTMGDDGNYKQSYFKIVLPQLSFDLYACAAITEEMSINMRSGACIGCTFPVMIDWDDYKQNFYDANGNFDPVIGQGHPRNGDKYPNSASGSITVIVQKDLNTFGTIMPNRYQMPYTNDQFVILGISLPLSYITAAEGRLDDAMIDYMRSNNVYYFDYPLKFDEHFLATHTNILSQMKTNTIVRFKYAGETLALYIKQMSVKFGVAPLPQYDITLTDDVEVVLNPVNKVADEVSRLSVVLNQGQSVDLEMLYAKFDERYDQRYISKINDDTAAGLVRLIRGLQVGERFVTGLLGEGGVFREESDGTTYLECDKLYVRMKAYFDTVEIRKFIHSGGNRIASLAGIKCSRVEYIDSNGDVTDDATDAVKFRCYFRADDNGETVTNDFVVGDLAFCKESNAQVGSGVEQHGYWRAVVGKNFTLTNDGEGWIDLSASDCLAGSDIPIAQDDIIQLGNKNDTTRQGAIVEYVGGADAPSYQIYQGINTYSLENKNYVSMGYNSSTARAYLNVYGDFRFGAKSDTGSYISYNSQTGVLNVKAVINAQSTIGNQSIPDYIRANQNNYDDSWIEPALQDIQDQIDGELDTWYYQGVPTLNNLPASNWTTDDEKKKHIGDLYYDKGTGYVYRFLYDEENETYYWTQIHDDAISEALCIANEAQHTADNKRRVFLTTPTPPYDAGDLWVNANYTDPATQQVVYSNDILKCIMSKTDGQSFSINDWTKASKYTDDSSLLTFLDGYQGTLTQVQDQIDKKAETWRQATDPSLDSGWVAAEHVGDIWMDTSANGGKKTYIYQRTGSSEPYTYEWVAQDVPDEVFDEIDGKMTIYVTWNAWMDGTANNLQVRDLFIPSADTTQGGITYKANKVYRCTNASTPTFQEIDYTDDTALRTFLDGYQGTLTAIRNQVDKKAETWYQSAGPDETESWSTDEEKDKHVGDLWHNTLNNKNYIYRDFGVGANPRYDWQEEAVPDEVFDAIDGKAAVYVSWGSWDDKLQLKDIYIPQSDYTDNTRHITYEKNKLYRCINVGDANTTPKFTELSYSQELQEWITNTYAPFVSTIQAQVDAKAETWVRPTDPATAWTTNDLKKEHVGDMWLNNSSNTVSGVGSMKTAIYTNTGTEANPVYAWVVDNTIPASVFDTIDGRATIYVNDYNAVTNDFPVGYHKNDLWIFPTAVANFDGYNIDSVKAGEVLVAISDDINDGQHRETDWAKKLCYTDDSKFDGYINQILNGSGASGDSATVANALRAIKWALNEGTLIDGGLVLTSLIGLRGSGRVWAGLSGQYMSQETGAGYKGHGIAAWFGGAMVDKEVSVSAQDFAKSLFRFDGSGYLAGGNISWNENGDSQFDGILRSKNLFHNVLFFKEAYGGGADIRPTYSYSDRTRKVLYFCKANYGSYEQGKYYEEFNGIGELENYFVPCSYDADIIMMMPEFRRNWEPVVDHNDYRTIYLPMPDDFEGKTIEVFVYSYGSTEDKDAIVGCVSSCVNGASYTERFREDVGIGIDDDGNIISYGNASGVVYVAAGTSVKFTSVKIKDGGYSRCYWIKLGITSGTGGGSGSGGGTLGTVTSVGAGNGLTTDQNYGAAITTGGNISINTATMQMITNGESAYGILQTSQTANTILAAPNGSAGTPAFRALVTADIPDLSAGKITSGQFATDRIPDLSSLYVSKTATAAQAIKSALQIGETGATTAHNLTIVKGSVTLLEGDIQIGSVSGGDGCAISEATVQSSPLRTALFLSGDYGVVLDGAGYVRVSNTLKAIRTEADTYISSGTIHIGGQSITPITSTSGLATESYVQGYSSISNGVITIGNSSITPLTSITNTYQGNSETTAVSQKGTNAMYNYILDTVGGWLDDYLDMTTSRTANTVLAAPNGSNGTPSFRALVAADIPDISGTYATKTWVGNQGYLTGIPTAAANTLGGIKLGYTSDDTNRKYKVEVDNSGNAYVNVPWRAGGSGTVTSVTIKGGSGISVDSESAITTSGTRTITNTGVRAVSINGNYLKVNTNGTEDNLTIPYATAAGSAGSAGYATSVGINYSNDSNSTYQMLWGSGNYVYGTGGIYCNPYTDYLYSGSFYCSNWFRSSGDTGWYSESYGGGWYMMDSTWIRSYGSKNIYCDQLIYASYLSAGGSDTTYRLYVAGTAKIDTRLGVGGYDSNFTLCVAGDSRFTQALVLDNGNDIEWSTTDTTMIKANNNGMYLTAQYNPVYVTQGELVVYHPDDDGYKCRIVINHSWANQVQILGTSNVSLLQQRGLNTAVGDNSYNVAIGQFDPSYKLHVNGVCAATSFTNTSDARRKDIDGSLDMGVSAIASAPAISYRWKDGTDKDEHVGTIAQYWQNVLPQAISMDNEGYLYMDYAATALVSVILTARAVVDHERRIKELEEENARLRAEIDAIKN